MHGQQNDKYTEMHGQQNDKYPEMHGQQNIKIYSCCQFFWKICVLPFQYYINCYIYVTEWQKC